LPPGWEQWNLAEKQKLLETLKLAASARRPRDLTGWASYHGIHLWSGQRTVGALLEDHKRVAVQASHSVGKSFIASVATAHWTDTRPAGLVISTAPSVQQVHGILWEEIRSLHRRLALPGRTTLNDTWMVGDRLAAFGRKPADAAAGSDFDPSTFQGYHRTDGVLVIIDEAGGVPEWLWDAVETVTTSDNSRILAIGNPDNPGSHFAKVCSPGWPGWTRHKISVFDSPNFTGEEVPPAVAAALVTPAWADERRAEWGADDHKYISKVLAEFPSDHPRQVVPVADLLACQFPEARSAAELLPVELGVDVGGGGDETVVRERRGIRAGRQWSHRSDKPEEISRLVLRAIRETGATAVKVDSIGVGAGVVGELRNMKARGDHGAEVHGVNVAEAAADPVRFINKRAEQWWVIAREGSQQRLWDLSQMDDADTTVAQLLTPRYEEDVKGRVKIEKKDDIRVRTGRSPDQADALLLAFYVARDGQAAYWEALGSGRLSR
jgi:hypothetical protein